MARGQRFTVISSDRLIPQQSRRGPPGSVRLDGRNGRGEPDVLPTVAREPEHDRRRRDQPDQGHHADQYRDRRPDACWPAPALGNAVTADPPVEPDGGFGAGGSPDRGGSGCCGPGPGESGASVGSSGSVLRVRRDSPNGQYPAPIRHHRMKG